MTFFLTSKTGSILIPKQFIIRLPNYFGLQRSYLFVAFIFIFLELFFPSGSKSGNWSGPTPTDLPEFLPRANPSVVMVICSDKSGANHFQGSGFFINRKGDVITSYHIVAGQKNIIIRTQARQQYKVTEILSKDIFGDLAKLAIDIPADQAVPAKLNTTIPKKGEEIFVIGHPLGHPQTISYGMISQLFPVQQIGHLLQFDAPITKGSSGSPIFNHTGEVVGITSFMLFPKTNQPSMNFAIPAASLLKM